MGSRISPVALIPAAFFTVISNLYCMTEAVGSYGGPYQPGPWTLAHATFYGDETASATMGGACGYGNLFNTGYGTQTAALSTTLYNGGYGCGQCFQMRCVQSKWCFPGSPITTVTATNLCPPNWAEASDNGGWCNPPRQHFDMAKPAFIDIADWHAGIVPVMYRRVPCASNGGIKFQFQGNSWWLLVYVMNVGGPGDVSTMAVKGSYSGWLGMSHNWGASYQVFSRLQGQSLSFRVTCYTTGQTIVAYNVAPAGWSFGETYQAAVNFH